MRVNLSQLSYRQVSFGLFLASVAGMAFALYLQHGVGLEPCPLCVFQRVGLMGMGLFALIAAIHNPQALWLRRVYAGLAGLSILWSTAVAARHVWLQHLPPEDVPACGPGLDYWLDVFPMKEVIQKVLHGSGECAVIDWTFLGLSLPTLSAAFFSVLLVICVWQMRVNLSPLSYRQVSFGLFLASVAGMAFALYLQHGVGLEPCPLCVFQRVGLMGMGLFALIAAIHNPQALWLRRVYAGLASLSILWSTAVAARHVWLQHLPPEDVPACGPGLDYWLDVFPMKEVIQKVLHGSGECAVIDWTFLGLSLPTLSAAFFSVLLVGCVWQVVRR